METKMYTQEQVNEIVEQVKARQQEKASKKIEANYVDIAKYKELEQELNTLKTQNKANDFKSVFEANGGNSNAYNDFINLNKEILSLDNEEQIKKLKEIKENKPYFFNKSNDINDILSGVPNPSLPNNEEVVKELLVKGNDPREVKVFGTVYDLKPEK